MKNSSETLVNKKTFYVYVNYVLKLDFFNNIISSKKEFFALKTVKNKASFWFLKHSWLVS